MVPASRCTGQPPGRARDAVVDYLTQYEAQYALPVRRPVRVTDVSSG